MSRGGVLRYMFAWLDGLSRCKEGLDGRTVVEMRGTRDLPSGHSISD